jgi:phytoene synthase
MIAAADLTACTATLQTGSRSFAIASIFLPARVRAPATALYAFCRAADDAIDLSDDQAAALDTLRARLDAIYGGRPGGDAVDRAFAAVVADFGLPRALPEALLEGFAWDVEARRYEDLPGLIGYAMRVAGTVGVMMALLMGTRDAAMLSAACDLGCAMQLTNIARDVGEDARAGRLYLPLSWLREEGIDPAAWLAEPSFTPGLDRIVAALRAGRARHRASAGALPPRHPGGAAALCWYRRGGGESRARLGVGAGGGADEPQGDAAVALLLRQARRAAVAPGRERVPGGGRLAGAAGADAGGALAAGR